MMKIIMEIKITKINNNKIKFHLYNKLPVKEILNQLLMV